MKKWFVGLTIAVSCFFATEAVASSPVIWDGAEIVSGQVGKMTFSKDVKVYKQNKDGTFVSMVVKRGNFFRVYSEENSSIGKVYNMSGGYRVQSTDLVIYREVPLSIQEQLGTIYKKGNTLFVSSKGGVSFKSEPTSTADSIGHVQHGAILKVLRTNGNYVKVMYDPYLGKDSVLEGFVPKDFVAALPVATSQYITEWVYPWKQMNESSSVAPYPRGQKVSTYFTAVSGYTYISVGNVYGFVKNTSLSKDKVVPHKPKLLQKIDSPANIGFETTKEIRYFASDNYGNDGYQSGVYKPLNSNTLEGKIAHGNYQSESYKNKFFRVNVSDKELVYRVDDLTIKIAFPLKVGDAIDVNGVKHKVEKIIETYTPAGPKSTVENMVVAGDFTIGKEYMSQWTHDFTYTWDARQR